MPKSVKGLLTRSIYIMGIKPTVNRKLRNKLPKGIVVLSADFEMAWAFQYSKSLAHKAKEKGLDERKNIPKIVELLDSYNIPVTWATVGHLFLENCKHEVDKIHPDMPRPNYFINKNWRFENGDWYQHDPGTDYKKDPAWYAPDLIDKILNAKTKHEVGCHTFSHIDFTYKNCPPELAEKEILKCKELAKEKNITLKTIVFPGGTAGNYELLVKHGFTSYRKPMDCDIDYPIIDKHGLVAIPSSYCMDKTTYSWSKKNYVKIAKSYINRAIKNKLVCHLWFHPSMDPWYLENVFPEILKAIDKQRKAGKIEVCTMQEIASRIKGA